MSPPRPPPPASGSSTQHTTNPATTTSITEDEAFATAYKQSFLLPPRPSTEFVAVYTRRGFYRFATYLAVDNAAPSMPQPVVSSSTPHAEMTSTPGPPGIPPSPKASQQALGVGAPPISTTLSPLRSTSEPAPLSTTGPSTTAMARSVSAPAAQPPMFVFGANAQQTAPAPMHPSFDFSRMSNNASSAPSAAEPRRPLTSPRNASSSSLATTEPPPPPYLVAGTSSSRDSSKSASPTPLTPEPPSPPSTAATPLRRAASHDHADEPKPKRTKLSLPPMSPIYNTGDTFLMSSDRAMTFKVPSFQLWPNIPKLCREYSATKPHMITFTHLLETAENIGMALDILIKRQPPAKNDDVIPLIRLLKHWECEPMITDLSNMVWDSLNMSSISNRLAFQIAAEANDYELALRVLPLFHSGEAFGCLLDFRDYTHRYYVALDRACGDKARSRKVNLQQAWVRHMRKLR